MKNISFFVLFTLTIFLILPLFAHAGIVPCGTSDNPEPCNLCHLFVGVKNIVDFLTYKVAFPLSIVGLLIGGFFILTGGGSEERLKRGKNAITSVLIGLVIIFASWLIISMIISQLLNPGALVLPWNVLPNTDPNICPYSF